MQFNEQIPISLQMPIKLSALIKLNNKISFMYVLISQTFLEKVGGKREFQPFCRRCLEAYLWSATTDVMEHAICNFMEQYGTTHSGTTYTALRSLSRPYQMVLAATNIMAALDAHSLPPFAPLWPTQQCGFLLSLLQDWGCYPPTLLGILSCPRQRVRSLSSQTGTLSFLLSI